MADDEEKKDEGEEETKEEEEDGEEGEDEDSDEELDDGSGKATYSPAAIEWAESHFNDKDMARYYEYASERSARDLEEMNVQREWMVDVRNIVFRNLDRVGDFFVQMQIGFNHEVTKEYDSLKAKGSGKERSFKWVESGTQGYTFRTGVKRNLTKGSTAVYPTRRKLRWKGSYFDLFDKRLRIELWDWARFGTNVFLADSEEPLVNVARGSMNREMQITGLEKEDGKTVERLYGVLTFVCVFQEVVQFDLKFLNWAGIDLMAMDEPEEDGDPDAKSDPFVVLNLNSSWHRWNSPLRSVSAVEPRTLDPKWKGLRGMTFRGTKLMLEESTLYVDVFDDDFFGLRRQNIGRCKLPLKGVVDNGYFTSELGYLQKPVSSGGVKKQAPKLIRAGAVEGQVDVTVPLAPMWREFLQSGDLNPPELRDYPPYNYTYLAIKIVGAQNLLAADENGLSDPFFTVDWAGQRQQTTVRRETLRPMFDETLYFHVRSFDRYPTPDELLKYPFVTLNCWDYDPSGSADALGTARLYLHSITGSPPKTPDELAAVWPQRHPEKLTVMKRKNPWSDPKPKSIMTRVFRGKLPLLVTEPGAKCSVTVEAWFRTPDGDLVDPDSAKASEPTGRLSFLSSLVRTEDRLLPLLYLPYTEPAVGSDGKLKADLCLCFSQFDLDEDTGKRRFCEAYQRGDMCSTFTDWQLALPALYEERGERLLEEVESAALGYNQLLLGKDQFDELHFLPEYLQAVPVPKLMIPPEEATFLQVRDSRKPQACRNVADFVNSVEYSSYFDELHDRYGEPRLMMRPEYVLDMRKGDIVDHAILLANLLLGLNVDVFVCIGRARTAGGGDAPHVWVMTREDDNAALGDLDGVGGAVKMWEPSTGTYTALRDRWEGQENPDAAALRRRMERMKEKGKKTRRRRRRKDADEKVDEEAEDDGEEGEGEDLLVDEEDVLEMFKAEERDVKVGLSEVFLEGAGTGDNWGRKAQVDLIQEVAKERHADRARKEREARERMLAEAAAAIRPSAEYLERKARIATSFADEGVPDGFIYTALFVVFNQDNLWANVQPDLHPAAISYDFESWSTDGSWSACLRKQTRKLVVPFFPARTLTAVLPEDMVNQIQNDIYEELDAGLKNFRSGLNLPTVTVPSITPTLLEVLVAKQALSLVDHSVDNGWNFEAKEFMEVAEDGRPGVGFEAAERLKSVMNRLLTSIPPGFTYRLKFYRLISTDGRSIRKSILGPPSPEDSLVKTLPELHVDGEEMFAVAAKVFPHPNSVAVTRCAIMCVYPKRD